MNAVTAILVAVLVHLGGVELDSSREATLQWFRESERVGQWDLEDTRAGMYRFVSDEGLVIVEGLRETNMTYTVQQFETVQPTGEETLAPVARPLRALGTVSLQPQAQNLRPGMARERLTVDAARVPVAWAQVTPTTEAVVEESAPPDEPEVVSPPASGTTVSISITAGQWSASHAGSGQVMVLQVR